MKVAHHARNASKKLFKRDNKNRDSQINHNEFYLIEDEAEEVKQRPAAIDRGEASRTAASMIGVDRSIKSFLEKFSPKVNGKAESEIGLSHIVLNEKDDEESGFDLQSRVDRAIRGDTIYLPANRIKIESLTINKPVTIVGSPGTVLEVSQTI